jgi:hypothetical protein
LNLNSAHARNCQHAPMEARPLVAPDNADVETRHARERPTFGNVLIGRRPFSVLADGNAVANMSAPSMSHGAQTRHSIRQSQASAAE